MFDRWVSIKSHPRVQISNFPSFPIFVGDLDVLMGAGVDHHVPGVAIQTIGPVIVTLETKEDFNKHPSFSFEITARRKKSTKFRLSEGFAS